MGKPRYIDITKNEITGKLQGNVYINYENAIPLEEIWEASILCQCAVGDLSVLYWRLSTSTKRLKHRKDRVLGFEDILHYQKIIVALTETDRLMKEIDTIEIAY